MVLGLLAVCGFSLTLPMTRLAVRDLDPVFAGLGRSLVSVVLAAVLLIVRREPLPGRRQLASLAVIALGVVVGFPLFSAFAMRHVPAAHGAVVAGLLPLATALCGTFRAHERPSAAFWLAAAAGTATVVGFVVMEHGLRPSAADLLLLLAVATCALGYAEGGRLSREIGGWRVISWALVLAAPFLAAPVAWSIAHHGLHASASSWAAFGYMGIVSMFLAFGIWYEALAMGGVARVSQMQLLQPFLSIGAAWALLGEHIPISTLVASALVVGTVAVGRRASIARTR